MAQSELRKQAGRLISPLIHITLPTRMVGCFLIANDSTNGRELWSVDSAMTAIRVTQASGAASLSSDPDLLTNINGRLFFRADDPTFGMELWSVNVVQ